MVAAFALAGWRKSALTHPDMLPAEARDTRERVRCHAPERIPCLRGQHPYRTIT